MKTNANEPMHPSETAMARYHGLTKREYFAGLAMQGLLANSDDWVKSPEWLAEKSICAADALLSALEKSK